MTYTKKASKRCLKQMTASEIILYMESLRDEKQRKVLMRFFKTGKGEYGEGDDFLGLKVPQTRSIVKNVTDLPFEEIPQLLDNHFHEIRLCGLLLLVWHFEKNATRRLAYDNDAIKARDKTVKCYIENIERANNWDLVDLSAPKILGRWLLLPTSLGDKTAIMDQLATANNLWRQRVSMVSTWTTLRAGDSDWCLRYAKMHLRHPHDLMNKAVGWMLREMGKHISMDLLRDFLREHIHEMPRTTLRYAIEKMMDEERKEWLRV